MKKTAIKFITLLLLLSLVITGFISCASEEEIVPNYGDYTTDDEVYDFNGYTFTFYVMTDQGETFFFPESSSSAIGDKILSRYKEVGDKFNANIVVSLPIGTVGTSIISAAASGTKYADLIELGARTIYTYKDYFVPLNELDGFDITSDKWGYNSYLQTTKFGDNYYGFMAGYWGMPYPQYIGNLYFMPEFLRINNLENPQEYYENGEWTWEVFRDLCTRATQTDPADASNNVYGFILAGEMQFPRAWILSNGGKPIKYDEEKDYYYYALNEPEAMEALQYIKDMLDDGIGYLSTGSWSDNADMFKNFKSLFFTAFNKSSFFNSPNHLANPDDFPYAHSWVYYPCGPNGTYGASTAQFWYTARFIGMLETFDDYALSVNTIIVNEIFEPLEGETTESWKESIERNFFFDSLSFKYYLEMFEAGEPDYSTQAYDVVFNNIASAYNAIFTGSLSVAEAVERNITLSQSIIDETLNAD